MKTTCYTKKSVDIIVPELDVIIIKKLNRVHRESAKLKSFTNYVWNDRAVEILANDYPKVRSGNMKIIELSRKVGKSYSSVRNKVRRMGLHY